MGKEDVEVRQAAEDDLSGALSVQRDAFSRVAHQLHIDPAALPPLNESLDDLRTQLSSGVRFFVAVSCGGTVVGAVRAAEHAGVVEVGRLVVSSGWVRRGIATRLMRLLESSYPHASRFTLFTGADATEPLALYLKSGYAVTRTDDSGPVPLVWLEKPGTADG